MTVTVCIPVWNGESFVEETLESVRAQTLKEVSVLVSVDRSDDRSVEICRALADKDPRFIVVSQPARLGWVGNVNWLLRRITSEFACILPHDDVLAPTYVARLAARLKCQPEAVHAFGDMETFGTRASVRGGSEVTGDSFTRIVDFLYDNVSAEAWRGVFRSSALERTGYLEEGSGAAADQTWLLRLVVEGHLIREPEVLYRKRLHADSVVAKSVTTHGVPTDSHWVDHCVACHRIALAAGPWTSSQRHAIAAAVLIRVMRLRNVGGLGSTSDEVLTAVLALVADYGLRLSNLTPPGADVMTPTDVPDRLRAHLRRALSGLVAEPSGNVIGRRT